MKRVAIFGGTFNPIHLGHINLCQECGKHIYLDKVILIPTNIPPHKETNQLADDYHRLQMCQLAVQGNCWFEVSDLEIKRKGVSYTIHTIEKLKQQHSDWKLYFLIGSDMLFMFHKWYQYQKILEQVDLIVGAREPKEYERMVAYTQKILKNHQNIHIIHIQPFPVSSTKIRQLIQQNQPVKKYLPSNVFDYIQQHHLYQVTKEMK